MRRALLAALLLLAPATAAAHELRPALLDLTDLGAGRYEVRYKPAHEGAASGPEPADPAAPAPVFPEGCRREPGGDGARFHVDCGPAGLAGRSVRLPGLGPVDALVRYHGPEGTVTAVLRASEPVFPVPAARGSRLDRVRGYFGAGVAHILRGPDHLLFVLGLLLLVRGAAALVRTITAFTLAHSVTLALAALGAVTLPPAPVEAVIALSLVVLAGELTRPRVDPPTLARRRPFLLAFSFGLLHGFGFAGGLTDLRVPAADLPLALGLFNLGVEAGQLAFVAAALLAVRLLRRVSLPPRLARLPAYAMGTVASFWLWQRLAQIGN